MQSSLFVWISHILHSFISPSSLLWPSVLSATVHKWVGNSCLLFGVHLEYDRVLNGCISSPSYCSASATSSLCGVQDILFIFKSHTLSMVGRISLSKCTIAISSQCPLRRHVNQTARDQCCLPRYRHLIRCYVRPLLLQFVYASRTMAHVYLLHSIYVPPPEL